MKEDILTIQEVDNLFHLWWHSFHVSGLVGIEFGYEWQVVYAGWRVAGYPCGIASWIGAHSFLKSGQH